jgi:tRNA pseudouridine38/39 synthase
METSKIDEAYLNTLSKEELIHIILEGSGRNKRTATEPAENEKPAKVEDMFQAKTQRAKVETKKRASRELDWAKYSTRHVAFKVLYVGWDYSGLAMQATEGPDNQIVETIEVLGFLYSSQHQAPFVCCSSKDEIDSCECALDRCKL